MIETPVGIEFDESTFLKQLPFAVEATSHKGVYAIPAAAPGFDINRASDEELAKNGIPWRPGADANPRFVEAWKKVFSNEWLTKPRKVPKFETQPGKTHNLKRPLKKVDNQNFVGEAWSGGGIRGGGPWGGIVGSWNVPTITVPTEPQGDSGGWDSSSWVGIDGFSMDLVSNDVLQAGVQQKIYRNGDATYVAWFEWFAPPQEGSPSYIAQTNFTDIEVHPGDEIICFIALFPQVLFLPPQGVILFRNETTGEGAFLMIFAPPGATASGNTIEWIMEAPGGGEPYTAPPKFTPIVFTTAIASRGAGTGSDYDAGNPQNGDTLNIETESGQVITNAILGDGWVEIDFIG